MFRLLRPAGGDRTGLVPGVRNKLVLADPIDGFAEPAVVREAAEVLKREIGAQVTKP